MTVDRIALTRRCERRCQHRKGTCRTCARGFLHGCPTHDIHALDNPRAWVEMFSLTFHRVGVRVMKPADVYAMLALHLHPLAAVAAAAAAPW